MGSQTSVASAREVNADSRVIHLIGLGWLANCRLPPFMSPVASIAVSSVDCRRGDCVLRFGFSTVHLIGRAVREWRCFSIWCSRSAFSDVSDR